MNNSDEILLIHMGGLGDVCLSEAAFLTLSSHFRKGIRAVGSKRVLERFGVYFTRIDSIDARVWTYLFSDSSRGRRWKRIIFFGKDREGIFRARLGQLTDELIFIDLYPDQERIPVEQYQLAQLTTCGMEPVVPVLPKRNADRIVLYPEAGFQKRKWSPGQFVKIFEGLKERELNVILMTPPGLDLSVSDTVSFEGLSDIEDFFSEGGIFFSNDSGLAHFAARCGLSPLTLFWDADPAVWQAKGSRILQCGGAGPTVSEVMDFVLSASLPSGPLPRREA